MNLPVVPLVVAAAVTGLAVGSFLNVVVARVPVGASVVRPRSACPACHHQIAGRDNVPVVSWLLLRRRCRHCRAPIALRYPAVEALTSALFAAAALRVGWSWSLPPVLVFFAGLVALGACDLERYLLPRRIVYPTGIGAGALLAVAAAANGQWSRLGVAALCSLGAFGAFAGLHAVNNRWLGFGDVRLAAVLGAVLGWFGPLYLLVGLLIANVVGLVVLVALIAAGRAARDTPVPYGVFLAAGAVLAVLAGDPLVAALTVAR